METINAISYYLNKCHTLSDTSQMTFSQEDSALVHMHCACNTIQLLQLSRLSLKPCPPTVRAECIDNKM